MRYMILIYGNEAAYAAMSEQELQADYAAWGSYTQDLKEQGALVSGDALLPTSTATTVRLRDGKTLTTHGPFAETAEQLGGFYIISCDNLDQALEWAAKNPGAPYGSIEVRPVMETEM